MHCESGDVLIDDVALPSPRRGDLLAVPATGAYTLAMASNYNGVPRPAAVLVRDGSVRVIRSAGDDRRPAPARGAVSDGLRTAAVLLPVFRDVEEELRIVLVVRADDGGQHGGQLGLPGGKPETGDADLLATALREAEEEVGLPREAVEVVATLEPLATQATGWLVHPFLGRVPADTRWRLQETEIVGILTPGRARRSPTRPPARRSRSRRSGSGSRSSSTESTSRGTSCGA